MNCNQDTKEKIIINISDRSRERASMDRIRQDLQEAQRSSAAKSRFLTTISHDMRTPMNAIMGLTDLAIEHMEEQEKVQEYLYKISRSSTHLLELINDVLDMSRIENGKMTMEYKAFSLTGLLQDVQGIIHTQADLKMQHLDVDWDLKHDMIIGDPVRIRQVLINILSNAVKYTQRGGHLVFQVRETGSSESLGDYEIKVYDNGYGMSESFQQIIFEPFAKEQTSDTEEAEGTGLGMSITKSLVDLMGGNLAVESRLGEGTVFTVHLPLGIQCGSVPNKESYIKEHNFDCKGKKMLLVEDNEIIADVLNDILELMGAEVVWKNDGEKAVQEFAKNGSDYDLILMDVQMPIMDGYEATRRIRALSEKGANVPIIALTGNAFTDDIQASKEAGMDHHLIKPVKKKELEQIIHQLLEH